MILRRILDLSVSGCRGRLCERLLTFTFEITGIIANSVYRLSLALVLIRDMLF